ncbi:unnamed protein product [Rhizopus microsporus]|uniref:Uncharacterized protein n=2 Tax=Rhizopus TaxID=4842 RepID=A0A1X0RTG8_RHIZD|nr:hypothetical protein BCV71DRAFT_257407 [Rhizopus microsporus]
MAIHMPGTTFKSKIYTILNKFTNIERCKRKHSQDTTHITEHPPLRKYSDATSVGTYDSTTSVIDRFRHALPFFRGRGSLNISPVEEMSMSEPFDYSKELEKLHSLYTLAQDEISYAEDSIGSFYYSGDILAAREALDNCISNFMQLLEHISDPVTREELRSSMTPKLVRLQSKIAGLPLDEPPNRLDSHYHNDY